MKRSLFVTVLTTILCGVLWISFLAARNQTPVLDTDEMVRVEGGTGNDPLNSGRTVTVAPFYIDKYEVTNAQFQRFRPEHQFLEELADFPVTNVSWHEAAAYAAWANKRLPTALEWELAAGIADGRLYPSEHTPPAPKSPRASRVGCYDESVSPSGCYDMEGNVWEWTADSYVDPAAGSDLKILKGGWHTNGEYTSPARILQQHVEPSHARSALVGFRCVRPE